jgi:hypothetical protein
MCGGTCNEVRIASVMVCRVSSGMSNDVGIANLMVNQCVLTSVMKDVYCCYE